MPNTPLSNSVIMISGPVGAGKSTISRELIASAPGPVAYIEGDTFWSFIVKTSGKPDRYKNFVTIMRAMTSSAMPFALAGYEVILDFSIPPWYLDTARKIAQFKDVPLDFVVVRPSEEVCAARAASRTEGVITDYAPYRDLYADFVEDGRYIIGDDTGDAVSTAALIREGLKAGKFRI